MCSSRRIGFHPNASVGLASLSRCRILSCSSATSRGARRSASWYGSVPEFAQSVRRVASVSTALFGREIRLPLRRGELVERPDLVPGLRRWDSELLEEVRPVGADMAGGVDRERPEVVVPLVARVARPDRIARLVIDEGSVDHLIERPGVRRSGRSRRCADGRARAGRTSRRAAGSMHRQSPEAI